MSRPVDLGALGLGHLTSLVGVPLTLALLLALVAADWVRLRGRSLPMRSGVTIAVLAVLLVAVIALRFAALVR